MTRACPQCGRLLKQEGEVLIDDVALPVFQCEDCTRAVDIFGTGELFPVPFYFVVGADGQTFDPFDRGDEFPRLTGTP